MFKGTQTPSGPSPAPVGGFFAGLEMSLQHLFDGTWPLGPWVHELSRRLA